MKCVYCNSELRSNYKYYNHSFTCSKCNIEFLYRGDNICYKESATIDGIYYSRIYFSEENRTSFFEGVDFICSLDGDIKLLDIVSKIKMIKVFS